MGVDCNRSGSGGQSGFDINYQHMQVGGKFKRNWISSLAVWGGLIAWSLAGGATPAWGAVAGISLTPTRQMVTAVAGEEVLLNFNLTNNSPAEVKIKPLIKDVETVNENGIPSFLPEDKSRYQWWLSRICEKTTDEKLTNCASGTEVRNQEITLTSQETKQLVLSLSVPSSELIKAHYLAVFFETLPQTEEKEKQVSFISRVGGVVELLLANQTTVKTVDLAVGDWQSEGLKVGLTNTGSVHLTLSGEMWLTKWWLGPKNPDLKLVAINETNRWLLPKKSLSLLVPETSRSPWTLEVYGLHVKLRADGQAFKERVLPVVFVGRYVKWLLIGWGIVMMVVVGSVLVWRWRCSLHKIPQVRPTKLAN